jgi:hypothetical protein
MLVAKKPPAIPPVRKKAMESITNDPLPIQRAVPSWAGTQPHTIPVKV